MHNSCEVHKAFARAKSTELVNENQQVKLHCSRTQTLNFQSLGGVRTCVTDARYRCTQMFSSAH